MSPFIQELISFISLMLGVIVLTAWVMWVLLRPSGDTKVKDFAEKSARDGLTQSVMENNELKNKITRLERENRVLMAAGYGKKNGGQKEDELKTEDEGLKIRRDKPAGDKIAEKVAVKKALVAEAIARPVADNKKLNEREKGTGKGKEDGLKAKDGGSKHENKVVVAEADRKPLIESDRVNAALKAKQGETADSTTQSKPESKPESKPRSIPESKPYPKTQPDTSATPVKITRPHIVSAADVSKQPAALTAKPVVNAAASKEDRVSAKGHPSINTAQPQKTVDDSSAESKARRLIEEAEKKKIAEYLANVEKTNERHKKEIEALAAKAADGEKVKYANDNLKRIKGIGPHLEVMLKKSGITSYQQIAEFSEKDIQRISDQIGSFPRRIKREAWVEQARSLLGKASARNDMA